MRWAKVAAIAAGVVAAYLAVSMVLGFLLEIAMIALVAGVIVLAVKLAFYRRQVSGRRRGEVREPRYTGPLPGRDARGDVEEEIARLRREMGE